MAVATLAVMSIPIFPLGPQGCPAVSTHAPATLGCPNEQGPNIWYNNMGVRVSAHLTALLTIVAFQLRIADQVPNSPTFTRLEWFYLAAKVLHAIAVVGVVVAYHIVV